MRIALDAMGGDHAPAPIVAGAVQAVALDSELHVFLVGDALQLEPLLAGVANRERLEVFPCAQVVGMHESPLEALRRKPDNSISRSWQLLQQKKVEGVVSAGNTGAMVAGGFRSRLFLKNVSRPGIATVMPTMKGECVMIDVGANVNPTPEHLFQYGVMGAIFAKHILQRPTPSIGVMNIGSEEGKGHDLVQETHALFTGSRLKDQFVGNIEGRDIHGGAADVVVCDAFVGNVVLKVSEGLFAFTMKMVAQELAGTLKAEWPLAKQALGALVDRHDYSTYGGAPLLGIDGICIICHGSSGEKAIKNALVLAAKYARAGLNQLIVKELEAAHAPA
jgi:glycerol-3-phosphate acyltransferase PlsX